jgi:hypothetical protein
MSIERWTDEQVKYYNSLWQNGCSERGKILIYLIAWMNLKNI